MLKSQILEKLQIKHNNLKSEDIETLFNLFIKKMSNSLKNGRNIEMGKQFMNYYKKRYPDLLNIHKTYPKEKAITNIKL